MRQGSGQRNKLARLGREEEAASGPTRRRGGSAFRCSLRVVLIYTRVVPVVDVFPCPETKKRGIGERGSPRFPALSLGALLSN